MKLLNLGCGHRFHQDWVNVDFISTGEGVIAHNLLNGVPFPDNEFDAVYHSHVLEHFNKKNAVSFIQECFRVLKPGGIIRVAVPDLEQIAREYIKNLEGALKGDKMAEHNYDWILIELFDQMIRTQSGGGHGEYCSQEVVPNEDYIIQRMGHEYILGRQQYLKNKIRIVTIPSQEPKKGTKVKSPVGTVGVTPSVSRFLKPSTYYHKARKILFKKEYQKIKQLRQTLEQEKRNIAEYTRIGEFRASGEIHQWMYDQFSLKRLLESAGFVNFYVATAVKSSIPDWEKFDLDTENNKVRKPDSLFVESKKPI